VREDYSADGDVWGSFPHDEARSRVYRWNEDGLAAVCDDAQILCFGFAFWNGADPILKERIFGLNGEEGNHGEDAKEYWWYLDSTPTHSFMRWRWLYPQAEFPYAALVEENHRRSRSEPEYELVDTGVLDGDRYFDVEITWAKAGPDDYCVVVAVLNAGPEAATLDLLPTLWFRNTWSWGLPGSLEEGRRPAISAKDGRLVAEHHTLGRMTLVGDGSPVLLCCDNESNAERLWGTPGSTPYPKDGIGHHVLYGAPTVNPAGTGTKAALHYRLPLAAGQRVELRLRLSPDGGSLGDDFTATMDERRREADEFYAALTPPGATGEEAQVLRQALAGMLWAKQFYHYDVARWLDGDPARPPPPEGRRAGRNAGWRHLNNHDVISMPDPWEYPWYAAWDLAFQAVALAHVDAAFAKEQLLLLGREWYMHPNGHLPAYEWNFEAVNPPVQAWAGLQVFEIDGATDYDFLARLFHKLLLNFTWWVNRVDTQSNNVFEGGFLGLDNIGPINRSEPLPPGEVLEQSDGTAWMGMFCLGLLEISLVLAAHDRTYEDMATKFFEHFALISRAIHEQGLWDEHDGFYYDVVRTADGRCLPLRLRSMVGLLPLCAATTLGEATLAHLPSFAERFHWFVDNKPEFADTVAQRFTRDGHEGRLLAMVDPDRLRRLLAAMLDEGEFLSPHGLRSLSAIHRDHPFVLELGGPPTRVEYEPGESTTGLFGGNSNWRGPVWFPVNYLVIEALRRYAGYFGDSFTVEYPTGSGAEHTLDEVADDLAARLVSIFLDDAGGRRPVFGHYEKFQTDPALHGLIPFHEYFHGDTGMGLGASHQTGWTGLVADLIITRAKEQRS
jgi:hypothetical protein